MGRLIRGVGSKSKKVSGNKKVRNATPMEVDGVKFKSKLELFTYRKLKDAGIICEYEATTYTLVPSFEYNGEKVRPMTYTPDFVNEGEFVLEVKGFSNDAFPLRWKLFKHKLFKECIVYDLYLPRNQREVLQVIQLILDRRDASKTKTI